MSASGQDPAALATPSSAGARCSAHPDRPAAGACSRCGAFYCPDCESPHVRSLCLKCASSSLAQRAERAIYRSAVETLVIFAGALLVPFALSGWRSYLGTLDSILPADTAAKLATRGFPDTLLDGVLVAAPFLACAVVAWTKRARAAVWAGVALQLLVVGAMLLNMALRGKLTLDIQWIGLLVLASLGVLDVRKIERFRVLARSLPRFTDHQDRRAGPTTH